MKDIFIDNNIAKDFSNPIEPDYLQLINWLQTYNQTAVKDGSIKEEDIAYLVVSQKLLVEYLSSARNASKDTSIPIIIDQLTREGRLNKFSNKDIENFKNKYFKKKIKFRSNYKDQNHLPIILMSERKMALTLDVNFKFDLENFPRFSVQVEKRPQDLNYY